jgi:DNA-binding PadR family transcriptional regulator
MNATERAGAERVLAAIGSDRLTGFETLARLDVIDRTAAAGEAFLYPALHRLEATGRLRASWATDSAGNPRRMYARTRRPVARL